MSSFAPTRTRRDLWSVAWVAFVLATAVLGSHAVLFDPGIDPASHIRPETQPRSSPLPLAVSPVAGSAQYRSASASQGSLVHSSSAGLGLPLGCRRSTDLFSDVCPKVSNAAQDGRSQVSSPRAIEGDLLICEIPSPEPLIGSSQHTGAGGGQPRRKSIAVSGTITYIENASFDQLDQASQPQEASSVGAHPRMLTDAYPSPGAEGFWRQNNGLHEWHPSQPDPGVGSGPSSPPGPTSAMDAGIASAQDAASSNPSLATDQAQIRAYDAWSAEQDGQGFLSFSEWKEKYVDSIQKNKAEAEKARSKSKKGRKARENTSATVPEQTRDGPFSGSSRARQDVASPTPLGASTGGETNSASKTTQTTLPPSLDDVQTSTSTASDPTAAASQSRSAADSDGEAESIPPATGASTTEPEADYVKKVESNPRAADVADSDVSKEAPSDPISRGIAGAEASSQLATLKHRWNFASFDCAAVVHRTNPSAKFASAILSEKKDRYMLSPCPKHVQAGGGEGQFVIVELCDEIMIDTLVLANYEFFSSMFKKLRVSAAERLKGREDDWTDLGTFRARNVRGPQVFNLLPSPALRKFYRYVRIDFLEHYGSEYYCPVSLLRVYGLTQMDDYYREREEIDKLSHSDVEAEDEEEEEQNEDFEEFLDDMAERSRNLDAMSANNGSTIAKVELRDEEVWSRHEKLFRERLEHERMRHPEAGQTATNTGSFFHDKDAADQPEVEPSRAATGYPISHMEDDVATDPHEDYQSEAENGRDTCPAPRNVSPILGSLDNLFACCSRPTETSTVPSGDSPRLLSRGSTRRKERYPEDAESANVQDRPDRRTVAPSKVESKPDTLKLQHRPPSPNGVGSGVPPLPPTPPSPNNGGGSESIYRAITRRLNALEANATLSLSYIEHSGQMLREVFARIEKRQEERMTDTLRLLNASNWRQIELLKRRQQVDLQRAIFEFDVHRQQADSERVALMGQVDALASEVMLEKRLGIAQLVLLFSLFIFMGLTRGSRAAPFIHSSIARISRTSAPRMRQGPPASSGAKSSVPRTSDSAGSSRGHDAASKDSASKLTSNTTGLLQDVSNRRRSSIEPPIPSPSNLGSPLKMRSRIMNGSKPRAGRGIERAVPLANSLSTVISPHSRSQRLAGQEVGLSSPNYHQRRARAKLLRQIKALSDLLNAAEPRRSSDPCEALVVKERLGPLNLKNEPTSEVRPSKQTYLPPVSRSPQATSSSVHVPSNGPRNSPLLRPPFAHDERERARLLSTQMSRQRSRNQDISPHQTPSKPFSSRQGRILANIANDELAAGQSSDWTERSEDQLGMSESDDAVSVGDVGIDHTQTSATLFADPISPHSLPVRNKRLVPKASPILSTTPDPISMPLSLGDHAESSAIASIQHQDHPLPTTLDLASHAAPRPAGLSALVSPTPQEHGSSPVSSRRFPPTSLDSESDSEGGAWQRVLPRRSASSSISRRSRVSTPESGVKSSQGDGPSFFLRKLTTTARLERERPRKALTPEPVKSSDTIRRNSAASAAAASSPSSSSFFRSGTPDTIRERQRAQA